VSVIVPPGRDDVVDMLSTFGSRATRDVDDELGSLERAWLIHQAEQRYGRELDLSDDQIARITTIAGAVSVLAEILADGDG
jgi:hypothetical protein